LPPRFNVHVRYSCEDVARWETQLATQRAELQADVFRALTTLDHHAVSAALFALRANWQETNDLRVCASVAAYTRTKEDEAARRRASRKAAPPASAHGCCPSSSASTFSAAVRKRCLAELASVAAAHDAAEASVAALEADMRDAVTHGFGDAAGGGGERLAGWRASLRALGVALCQKQARVDGLGTACGVPALPADQAAVRATRRGESARFAARLEHVGRLEATCDALQRTFTLLRLDGMHAAASPSGT
jgi:hypothetical protein